MRLAVTLLAAATLLGCSTTPKYSCGAPLESGGCRSVSRIHAAALGPAVPAERAGTATAAPSIPAAGLNSPVMSAPRTLRIQVFPYQDGDGDLHGASYLHVRIGSGEWVFANGP